MKNTEIYKQCETKVKTDIPNINASDMVVYAWQLYYMVKRGVKLNDIILSNK